MYSNNNNNNYNDGFAILPAPQAIGCDVGVVGGGVQAIRKKIEELPTVSDAMVWLMNTVKAENRQDLVVNTQGLRMDVDGTLEINGKAVLMSELSFKQLLQMIKSPPNAGGYLASIPAYRRAKEFNHILETQPTERDVVLRIRDNGRYPVVFSTVTERYTALNIDTVASRIAEQHHNLKAEVIYSDASCNIKLFNNDSITSEDLGTNEAFAAVTSLTLADNKTGGISISHGFLRSLCTNLMLVATDYQHLMRMRHIGNQRSLFSEVERQIRMSGEHTASFLNDYREATKIEVVNPKETFHALTGVTEGKKANAFVQLTGIEPIDLSDKLLVAWQKESNNNNKAGICNAITKAAHTEPWPNIWDSRTLEVAGSKLLQMPNEKFQQQFQQQIN